MARLFTTTMILVSVILLFHFGGILGDEDSPISYVLGNLGLTNPQNFGGTNFWAKLLFISTTVGAGILIGAAIFTRSVDLSLHQIVQSINQLNILSL